MVRIVMSKEKQPSFEFYPQEYLSLAAYICLTFEEKGVLIELFSYMWLSDNCSLPNDDSYICRILGVNKNRWARLKKTYFDEKYNFLKIENNRIINVNLKAQYDKKKLITPRLPASEWRERRENVFRRDDYTCEYCGDRGGKLECDHVVPVSKGGSNEYSNLVTACFKCNRSKRDKMLGEWLQ